MTKLTQSQTLLLAGARTGHLATADENGVPHVIPVCFVLGEDVASRHVIIYSVLDQKPKRTSLQRLRRVRNILSNPQVALVVDHYEEDWNHLWYILVKGRAKVVGKVAAGNVYVDGQVVGGHPPRAEERGAAAEHRRRGAVRRRRQRNSDRQ